MARWLVRELRSSGKISTKKYAAEPISGKDSITNTQMVFRLVRMQWMISGIETTIPTMYSSGISVRCEVQ